MTEFLPASLHLDSGRDLRGGQRQVLFLLRGLTRLGAKVLLCCPKAGALHKQADAEGIPCEALTMRSSMDFPSSVRLAKILSTGTYDLVHAHDSHSHSIGMAAQGLTHDRALAHNFFVTRRNVGKQRGVVGRVKYANDRVRFIAISNAVRDSLTKNGVSPHRIVVVPSGVDVDALESIRARPVRDPWDLRQPNRKIVGTIGHLTREKNHVLLVESFAELRKSQPGAHLVIAGDGPMRKSIERKVQGHKLDEHVTLTGHLDDVTPALQLFDVFALSSDVEGLCTSLLDAMAAGIPVATTAAGGVLMIARHGVSALVVPPRDPAALAGAMARLLQVDPADPERPDELVTTLIQGGRAVARKYSIDNMVQGTLGAYQSLGNYPKRTTET